MNKRDRVCGVRGRGVKQLALGLFNLVPVVMTVSGRILRLEAASLAGALGCTAALVQA